MKTKTLLCCLAAVAMALVGCKKEPADPTPEALTLTPDKTEEYAGGRITITSNNAIKSFTAKDNIEIRDAELSVEQTSDCTLTVCPGSGSMRYSGGAAHMDSDITITVTDVNDQTETIKLAGKSWFFEARAYDQYGSRVDYTDMKVGDKVYMALTSTEGKNISTDPGFSLSFEGNAYKILSSPSQSSSYYECQIKDGASDYEITASYKSRIIKLTPKSVNK